MTEAATLAVMPNTPGTTRRTIRVADEIWEPAKKIANAKGTDLSTVIRDGLIEFIDENEEGA